MLGKMREERASVTVEAALVLPVFISVILSILVFIRVVYVHAAIQNALTQTVQDVSMVSYLYHAAGLDASRAEEDPGETGWAKEAGDILVKGLQQLWTEKKESVGTESSADLYSFLVKSAAAHVEERLRNEMARPLMQAAFMEYMRPDIKENGWETLGIKGNMDFGKSSFLAGEDSIILEVSYTVSLPVPLHFLPPITLSQRAASRAWLGGTETGTAEESSSLWLLPNFERGRMIRQQFQANLPGNFPVIASFQGGTATMIKSLDATLPYYQAGDALYKQVRMYIDELQSFAGQEKPWGSEAITILPDEIRNKILLLVIPRNPLSPSVELALQRCRLYALSRGIHFELHRYGYKDEVKT